MTELLTAAEMRAIEQAAIASAEVSGLDLMERAGRGVVEAIFAQWPALRATSHRAVVLCGPGGNGGDGFVVARLLREWCWEVEVCLSGQPERMPPDARAAHDRWVATGSVRPIGPGCGPSGAAPDLLVDALFGIGLTRPLAADLVRSVMELCGTLPEAAKVVAVDIPSGLCADSGRALGQVATGRADLTVTFHRPKLGHVLGEGSTVCGALRVADIGLGGVPDAVRMTGPSRGLGKGDGHKCDHGHALVLSGPSGRGGAARLAARGALRVGAGLVTVGSPPDAIPENAARLDAVMLRAVADGAALAQVLGDRRINALCLGPGLGLDARGREVVAVALGVPVPGLTRDLASGGGEGGHGGPGSGPGRGKLLRSLVLDADALTILSQRADLFAALHPGCILTPHAGEFARLFPDIAEMLAAPATRGPAYSKVDATREAAARAGCVVLFKGPDTVIADASGCCAVNAAVYDRAAPWLATAGSGDVLAGIITGLLARGFGPFDAACLGARLHVDCALSFGPGMIAEDLPEELPKVFRALGL
ncbi:MAG: NAD(P)H-hydrate epimerase [Paracoccaceae bacterium]